MKNTQQMTNDLIAVNDDPNAADLTKDNGLGELLIAGNVYPPEYFTEAGLKRYNEYMTANAFKFVYHTNQLSAAGSSFNQGLYYLQTGKVWAQSNITTGNFNFVYHANNLYIAGSASNNGLYYSRDGKIWTQSNITTGNYISCIFADGGWVACRDDGMRYGSLGGEMWWAE